MQYLPHPTEIPNDRNCLLWCFRFLESHNVEINWYLNGITGRKRLPLTLKHHGSVHFHENGDVEFHGHVFKRVTEPKDYMFTVGFYKNEFALGVVYQGWSWSPTEKGVMGETLENRLLVNPFKI